MAKKKKTTTRKKSRPVPDVEGPPVDAIDPAIVDFDQIIGQDQAIDVLRASVASGRVHHAWVFVGPPGVGKRTTAEAFAALLLDPTASPGLDGVWRAAPESPTQGMVARRTHPDLHIITKELASYSDDPAVRARKQLTIPKEVLRDHLLEPIARAATIRTEARAQKVFIIDEAERMDRSISNAPTQNSLLKTLEEPPDGSVIILIANREQALLPTIRSRCQRVTFRRLMPKEMSTWFVRADLEVSAKERAWIEQYASGSPGLAQLAARTGLASWADRLEPLIDRALLGGRSGAYQPDLGPAMAELVNDWADAQVKANARASKEALTQAGVGLLVEVIGEHLRSGVRAQAECGQVAEPLLIAIDHLAQAERYVAANVGLPMVAELMAGDLAAVGAGRSSGE
ncbi:MAG: AAA family ATPase [Phycisphaerales bacterium]|nr:AAA family ATPase [Phycisphaerales bacterium]